MRKLKPIRYYVYISKLIELKVFFFEHTVSQYKTKTRHTKLFHRDWRKWVYSGTEYQRRQHIYFKQLFRYLLPNLKYIIITDFISRRLQNWASRQNFVAQNNLKLSASLQKLSQALFYTKPSKW